MVHGGWPNALGTAQGLSSRMCKDMIAIATVGKDE
jgi:hypothetical protein